MSTAQNLPDPRIAEIPEGLYCYTPVQAPCAENGWVFRVKPCPFWQHYDKEVHGELPDECKPYEKEFQGAYCTFLKTGDWLPDGTMLLWDQVKECGENYGDDSWDEVE